MLMMLHLLEMFRQPVDYGVTFLINNFFVNIIQNITCTGIFGVVNFPLATVPQYHQVPIHMHKDSRVFLSRWPVPFSMFLSLCVCRLSLVHFPFAIVIHYHHVHRDVIVCFFPFASPIQHHHIPVPVRGDVRGCRPWHHHAHLCSLDGHQRETTGQQMVGQWGELTALIARFMGPTWGPSRADRTQVGPMNLIIWEQSVSI